MTAPDPIDLDHLDALYAAASVPMSFQGGKAAAEQRAAVLDAVFNFGNAMVEAWPAISAELRSLRDRCEAAERAIDTVRKRAAERGCCGDDYLTAIDKQGDDDGN